MGVLNIDVETYSNNPIKLGVHKYCAGGVELLLFGYSLNGSDVRVIDVAQGEEIPREVLDALWDPRVIKKAWNAAFEIEVLSHHFGMPMKLNQWSCTMIRSAKCGYPLSLDFAGKAMNLKTQKDAKGKALIKLFSEPRNPTAKNPATRIYPADNPEKWAEYIEYNRVDVLTEMEVDKFLSKYPEQPHFEHLMYVLDRQINKRGVELDLPYIRKMVSLDAEYKERLTKEAAKLTGLENPNSLSQLKNWLEEQTGKIWKGLDKQILKDVLELGQIPYIERHTYFPGDVGYEVEFKKWSALKKNEGKPAPENFIVEVPDGSFVGINLSPLVRKVLELRKELSNTSVKKYLSMLASEVNGRIYDTIQFNGAGRTGRNAGRLIQPQNLPRITMSDLELATARDIVKSCDLETVEMCYESTSSVLSQLIRTALISKKGRVLRVCDLSAIEARVLAWVAREEHVLEVFRTHGKIYEATAAMMFKVPMESITKGSEMRQRGKVSSLACGYQGSVNALTQMDSDKAIPDSEKPGLVKAWRAAHPNIVKFWYKTQEAAIKAINNPGEKITLDRGCYFVTCGDSLLFYLPSGRYLTYPKVSLVEGAYGPKIVYWGLNDQNKWGKLDTYGGKLVENLVQAIARDVLMVGMYNMVKAGYEIVFNVHDEIVAECDYDFGSLKEIEQMMCDMPSWADGLPLGAEGFNSEYYKK